MTQTQEGRNCNLRIFRASIEKVGYGFFFTHLKSCDQSLYKASFDFFNIFCAIQGCANNAKNYLNSITFRIKLLS